MPRRLLATVVLAAGLADPAAAQISAADSASLLTVVINRVRAEFTSGPDRQPIALRGPASRSMPGSAFGMRVFDAVRTADSARITDDSTRYLIRVGLGGLNVSGDTARFTISRSGCRTSGRMRSWSLGYAYVFVLEPDGSWTSLPNRAGVVGDGFRCPWRPDDTLTVRPSDR